MSKRLSPFEALKELVSWANNPYYSLVEGSEEEKALVEPIEKALEEWLIDKEFITKLKAEIWKSKLEEQIKICSNCEFVKVCVNTPIEPKPFICRKEEENGNQGK